MGHFLLSGIRGVDLLSESYTWSTGKPSVRWRVFQIFILIKIRQRSLRNHPDYQRFQMELALFPARGSNYFRRRAQGNVLDLWAAVHRLPLYEAALHLAETFNVPRNREEEPVQGTR